MTDTIAIPETPAVEWISSPPVPRETELRTTYRGLSIHINTYGYQVVGRFLGLVGSLGQSWYGADRPATPMLQKKALDTADRMLASGWEALA